MVSQNFENIKSSYPGMWKKPSELRKPFRSPEGWLKAKQKDDDVWPFWRVHDKLYDLSSFAKKHPGGSHFIDLTKGTDITEAFETSHIANPDWVELELKKYYVKDAENTRNAPFTFKPDGFYMTLKKRVQPIAKKYGTGSTIQIRLIQDTMVLFFVVTALAGSFYRSMMLQIISGSILGLTTIGAHNFFHLKQNWRKYYFDLSLITSHECTISHSLSHHLFPNTLLDLELEFFPGYEFLPVSGKGWVQAIIPVTSLIHFPLGFWLPFFMRWISIFTGKQRLRWEYLIPPIQLILLAVFVPLKNALESWVIIHTVSSFVFYTIGVYASHHHTKLFHDLDEARPDPDFGLCQIDATSERITSFKDNIFLVMFSFGDHVLHHLFPTVCHSKLHHFHEVFKQTVSDFKEQIHQYSALELYVETLKQLKRTEPQPFSQIQKKIS